MTQQPSESRMVPALGFHCLTPLYDTIVAATARERTVKRALIRQAGLEPGQLVLDLGSGSGTLAIWIKQHLPRVEVRGVDGDGKILAIACRKALEAKVTVPFEQAHSCSLPYRDGQFDRVLSSMFFHHLSWRDKNRTAQEILRVLRPGAQLHVADWGLAGNLCMRGLFLTVQLVDGFERTRDHVNGRYITLFEQNGFADVRTQASYNTVYGTITLFSATRPG
jgi:ubiquinone/menaquinone biosynthesis C-methylase UbiE